jgi:hypothetical protein
MDDTPAPASAPALSRDQFLVTTNTPTPRLERVPMPERKGYLMVAELSASRLDLWEAATLKRVGTKVESDYTDYRAKAVALSLWDETTGDWMCTLEDAPQIGRMSAREINRLFQVFVRLNAIRAEDLKELEETLAKDLAAAG